MNRQKKKLIDQLRKDIRRKAVLSVIKDLLRLLAILRFPIINRILYTISIIFSTNQTPTLMEEDKSTLKWIKTRLKEPTTWMGFITLAGVAGITLEIAIVEAVAIFVASGIGVILVVKKERAEKED